ncbi:MAG: sigma-70 family RNA polymerase sigma factor [Bacteroidota bacterium]
MTLLKKIHSGDRKSFEGLYKAFHKRVYFFSLKSTQNEIEAEDLTQTIFIKIWENRSKLSLSIPLETQVFKIARTTTIDFYRAKTAQQKLLHKYKELNGHSVSDETESIKPKLDSLNRAIEELPKKRKEIFKLSRYHGLTHEEIAQELSISKNTVHVQISKALQTLRSKLT